jgi:acetyl-CoA carboxylase carboxyltransferase component
MKVLERREQIKQLTEELRALVDAKDVEKAKAKKEAGEDVQAFLAEKEDEYTEKFANPYEAASYGYIDDVIEPRNTRFRICRGLAQLATKRQQLPAKKHGCMPM